MLSSLKPAAVFTLATCALTLPIFAADAPPAAPKVLSAVDIGLVKQNSQIYGRDGTWSALVSGKSFWGFNDTSLKKNNATNDNFIPSSLAWTTKLNASSGLNLNHDLLDSIGGIKEFMPKLDWEQSYNDAHNSKIGNQPPIDSEYALWNGALIPDATRNRLLIMYGEIYRDPAISGWTELGAGIAVCDLKTMAITRPVENAGSDYPTLMWAADETAYNIGACVVGDTLYAYGGIWDFISVHYRVARVALADALDKTKWTYFAGNDTWSTDPAAAITIFDGSSSGSSVFYNAYLGQYTTIYSRNLGNQVAARVAPHPWGPWSAERLLFTGRPTTSGSYDYVALAHPEFAEKNGKIQYVTYAHTTGFLQQDLPTVKVEFTK